MIQSIAPQREGESGDMVSTFKGQRESEMTWLGKSKKTSPKKRLSQGLRHERRSTKKEHLRQKGSVIRGPMAGDEHSQSLQKIIVSGSVMGSGWQERLVGARLGRTFAVLLRSCRSSQHKVNPLKEFSKVAAGSIYSLSRLPCLQ